VTQIEWKFSVGKDEPYTYTVVLQFNNYFGGYRKIRLNGNVIYNRGGLFNPADLFYGFNVQNHECVVTMTGDRTSRQCDLIVDGTSITTGLPVPLAEMKEAAKKKTQAQTQWQWLSAVYIFLFALGRPFVEKCLASSTDQIRLSILLGVMAIAATATTARIINQQERSRRRKIAVALPVILVLGGLYILAVLFLISRYQLRFDCSLLRWSFFLDLLRMR
jgi:hypothetical protein